MWELKSWELRMSSGESKEEEVMSKGIGESEMEELEPNWSWQIKAVDSRDKVKCNQRSD